jgi:wyosine [tRNA(Phe)-imidazoG37] synthetase (radical SAM superfamily)
VPSLDAGSEEVFETVNRPHSSLKVDEIVDGLTTFRSRYGGTMRLEILLLDDINAVPGELERLRALARRIEPDGIDLNSVARPPAERHARAIPYERLEEIRGLFGKKAKIVFRPPLLRRAGSSHQLGTAILEMVGRRPCTIEELSTALGAHRHEVSKFVGALVQEGRIVEKRHGNGLFFMAVESKEREKD